MTTTAIKVQCGAEQVGDGDSYIPIVVKAGTLVYLWRGDRQTGRTAKARLAASKRACRLAVEWAESQGHVVGNRKEALA